MNISQEPESSFGCGVLSGMLWTHEYAVYFSAAGITLLANVDSCTNNVATMVYAYRQDALTKLERLKCSIFPEMLSAQRGKGRGGV